MSYKIILFFLLALFTLSCSDSKPDKLVVLYTDDLNSSSLATNAQRGYSVSAHYDNGEEVDVSSKLLWYSSDTTLATVLGGLVSAKSVSGSVDISYTTKEKLSDGSFVHQNSMTLEIKDLNISSLSLSLVPSQKVFVGKSAELKAEATFEDNSTADVSKYCDFNSSNEAVATVDVNGTTISGVSEGNTTIVAFHRNQNISSNSLIVEVVKVKYTKIEIVTQNSVFNLEQSIELEVRGDTNDGQTIILESSELTWHSSDTELVKISSNGIAVAMKKGTVTITATVTGTNTVDSTDLTVDKDEYMRLFDGSGKELIFDTPERYYFTKDTNNTLATFTIKAVGKEFTVRELNVTDFEGNSIFGSGTNYFDTLQNADTILLDENRTFSLMYDNKEELIYTFKIDDDVGSQFIQRYEEKD